MKKRSLMKVLKMERAKVKIETELFKQDRKIADLERIITNLENLNNAKEEKIFGIKKLINQNFDNDENFLDEILGKILTANQIQGAKREKHINKIREAAQTQTTMRTSIIKVASDIINENTQLNNGLADSLTSSILKKRVGIIKQYDEIMTLATSNSFDHMS